MVIGFRFLMVAAAVSAGAAALASPGPAPARGAARGSAGVAAVWGRAEEVPGLGTLNVRGRAGAGAVSCAAPGQCAAGGGYSTFSVQGGAVFGPPFVVSEINGVWGKAEKVPGFGLLPGGVQGGSVTSVSCPAAGDCTAVGDYSDKAGFGQGFVVSEAHGVWDRAKEVPGLGKLNRGHASAVSVSCAAPGRCAVGGHYQDGSGDEQGFVASEVNGVWGNAEEVPGLARLNTGGSAAFPSAAVASVSCTAPDECVAAGGYTDGQSKGQAFVASAVDGAWGQAREVPGLAAVNVGGGAVVESVSCPARGRCVAAGEYTLAPLYSGREEGFVVSQVNGAWGTAKAIPGFAALNVSSMNARVLSVSCGAAGQCAAAGFYTGRDGREQGFVVTEVNGAWGNAEEVPGLAALSVGGGLGAEAGSVSCAAAGQCAVTGIYPGPRGEQGFVASEVNGRWGKAGPVPGLAALSVGGASDAGSVSCARPGGCAAGGSYTDRDRHTQGFVVSGYLGRLTAISLTLSKTALRYGHEQAERFSAQVVPATAPGSVTVEVITKTGTGMALCTIKLTSGHGTCTLRPRQLGAGAYGVAAAYPGSTGYAPSISARKNLTVRK